MLRRIQEKLNYTRIIALGFVLVILIGTALLSLPISARNGERTPFLDCLFTATSATCVTGLVVQDTCLHWSVFGQVVILFMIQIGGLGLMTVITMFALFAGKKLSLHDRRLLAQSAGNFSSAGMTALIKKILLGTFIFEGIGIIVLALRFCPSLGLKGLWFAVFHSVSAFCNAGFDLMGGITKTPFGSFTQFYNDPVINLTLMFLIVMGGLGFLVWSDLLHCKLNVKKYKLHTKLILVSTAILLVGGTILFFIFEYNSSLAGMKWWEKLLASAFQSVSARTAGFSTVDLASLSGSGNILMDTLMIIGGSPGSCAGGMKTTTVAVVLISTFGYARNMDSVTCFKRKISEDSVRQAYVIFTVYLSAVLAAVCVVSAIEPFSIKDIAFELVSAIATVGISTGITTSLSTASKLIVILLMYAGRIGGLTLILAIAQKKKRAPLDRPTERILIG